jgi:hypothetical protein
VNYACSGIALFLVAGCHPSVEELQYDPAKNQILFLYDPASPQQVFYRDRGLESAWRPTPASTLEQAPPTSGPWKLERSGWTLVFARDGQLSTELTGCQPDLDPLQVTASRLAIEPCTTDRGTCCRQATKIIVGRNSSCRILEGWAADDALCVARIP